MCGPAIAALLAAAGCQPPAIPPTASAPAPVPTETAPVDRVVEDALTAWGVPGVAVAVVRGDDTLVLKGYGRKAADRPDPVSPDTSFPLASCTKAFTATLLGMLADDGVLVWDDPVRKHLPDFHLRDPGADSRVTLRDLVSHRTGVAGNDLLWYRAPWGVDEVLKRAAHLPPAYPFRGGFDYNSVMFMAAGRVAERAAGRPWEQLVRDRITGPLGMTGVTFTTTEPVADRAAGHRVGTGGAVEPMPRYEIAEPNPAGSMNATARDLAAWLKFQANGGVGGGRRLISEANLKETRTPHAVIPLEGTARAMNPDTRELRYGMGWIVSDHRGKRVLAHGGTIDGFRTQVTVLPDEKLGVALMNNLHETRMNQAVTNALVDHYCGLPPRDWNAFFLKIVADEKAEKASAVEARNKARKPDTKPSAPPAAFAGVYEDAAYGTATVTPDGGRLVLAWSSFRCPLEHFQDDVFRVTDGYFADRLVEFAVDPARGPTALRFIGVVFGRK